MLVKEIDRTRTVSFVYQPLLLVPLTATQQATVGSRIARRGGRTPCPRRMEVQILPFLGTPGKLGVLAGWAARSFCQWKLNVIINQNRIVIIVLGALQILDPGLAPGISMAGHLPEATAWHRADPQLRSGRIGFKFCHGSSLGDLGSVTNSPPNLSQSMVVRIK